LFVTYGPIVSDISANLVPDPVQMRRHLGHLFEGWLDGCHEGRVELAWTDARDGKLSRAELFGTDELDEVVERAVRENQVPGQNVYIGQALRRPDVVRSGRCGDDDFFALTTLYADLDDDVTARASANCRNRGCRPTAAVITGRLPFVRAQVLWRLETPIRDPVVCRQQILALARALDGDRSVFNPGRVLRLGGSIAWPVKEGRRLERTAFMDFDDGRPKVYMAEAIARAFAPLQAVAEQAPADSTATSPTPKLRIGISIMSVVDCISAIRRGDHWHNNLLKLTAHWIGRGWSDAEIQTAAEALTLSGYTIEHTRRDVAQMIAGARRKWGKDDPTHNVEEEFLSALDLTEWTADRYAGEAKPIRWLCRGTVPLGVPVLVAAMGGLGKSLLALDLALHAAAGVVGLEQPHLIFGGRLEGEGTAVVVTAEDSFDAIHRRLNRIDPEARRLRHPQRLIVLPTSSVGGAQPLITVDRRTVTRAPFLSVIREQLARFDDLRLVVFDPLQAFVAADVNADPAAAQFLWSTMSELAATTGATVLLTHHMRKEGMSRIVDADDAREAIRGTTALVDGARLVYALWKVDKDTAKPICDQLDVPFEPGKIVRAAVVKANDEANYSMHTYVRQKSGLLIQREEEPVLLIPESDTSSSLPLARVREVLAEVQRRFDAGVPFSPSTQGQARYLGHYLARQLHLDRKAAAELITDWLNNGVLTVEVCNRKTKLSGLKVQRWI
jgi:hypothetical protein